MSATADVVVVGAGPAGLRAALAAREAGASVLVLDAYAAPGGQYYHQPPEYRQHNATERQQDGRALWERAAAAGAHFRLQTAVWNLSADRRLSVIGPDGMDEIEAGAVVIATGAYERLAAFPGWTLPGVITAGAAQILLYQGVRPGRRVLLAGAGPLQLVTAAHLLEAGVAVVEVLEAARLKPNLEGALAMWGQWGRIREGAASLARLARSGVPYQTGWGILSAEPARNGQGVGGAVVTRLDSEWRPVPGSERSVVCDTICTGYGFIPLNGLSRLAGAAQVWRDALGGEIPCRDAQFQTSVPGIFVAGDGASVGGYRLAMLEGATAGGYAAAASGSPGTRPRGTRMLEIADARAARLAPALRQEQRFQQLYARLFIPRAGLYELARPDTLVCRCEGVPLAAITAAVQAGAVTSGEVKAATRCGMGECQGRICGPQVAHILARLTGMPPAAVGVNPARPPLFPIAVEEFVGEID